MAMGILVANSNKLAGATNPLRAFRSELVSLIAASAGIYAIKEQLVGIYQAGSNLAANKAKFSTAFGSVDEGNKEMAYAREVATNLKLPIDSLTKSYADLALAAKGTKLEGQGARDVFVAFAQVARVNQTSTASLDGVFTALTQIMSKGKIQAEELRQQLGDRLPGAMQLLAEGLGVSTEKLDKMMQKGELTRTALLNMAAAASGRVGPALIAALSSPAARLQDFQNRLLTFKETIAGAGFLDAVSDAFDKLAKALSAPEAIQAAKDLGVALADIVKWATDLVSNGGLDTIANSVKALGAAWVAVQITSLVTGLYSFTTAVGATAIAVLGLDAALAPVLVGLTAVGAVVAVAAAAFGAWKLAQWVYDNVPAFAEGIMTIKKSAGDSFDGIVLLWKLAGIKLVSSFESTIGTIKSKWYGMLDALLKAAPELTAKVGLGDYAADVAKQAADGAEAGKKAQVKAAEEIDKAQAEYAAKQKDREQDLQSAIAGYYTTRINATLTEEEKAAAKLQAAQLASALKGSKVSFPGAPEANPALVGTQLIKANPYKVDTSEADQKKKDAAAKKAAAARLSLEKSVADQMFTIRSNLEKKSAETTDEMVAAVPAKYAKLYGQLTALGKGKTSQEWMDVDALVAQEQQIIRNTQAKKKEAADDKLQRELETAENEKQKELMETVNALMESRRNIQEQLKRAKDDGDVDSVNTLNENLVKVTAQAAAAISTAKEYWTAFGGPEADVALAKLGAAQLALTKVKKEGVFTAHTVAAAFTGTLTSSIDTFVDSIEEAGLSFNTVLDFFRNFAVDFLKQMAKMILQQAAFNALSGALGGATSGATSSTVTGLIASSIGKLFHNGGTVGAGNQTRSNVNPAIFHNAVKYHGGGVAGLKSNEVPAILQAGETVRTQQQEKALADRQAAAGGGAPAGQSLTIVNALDTESLFSQASQSAAFGTSVMNQIKFNKSQIKSLLR